jgi:Spy/CpxP family protein refolding chaperone
MQRTKQQALMFVLGAVLVGGVLGASADRYIVHDNFASSFGPRSKFYDAIGLTEKQRTAMDSLAFMQDCSIRSVLTPQKSSLDSIRAAFKAQVRAMLTPGQLAKLDERDKENKARRDAEMAKEPKRTCSAN